jgi:hypothetical protein
MKRTDPFVAIVALLCRLPWGVHAFLAVASAFAAAFLIPAYLDLASFTPVATLAAWMACIGFTTAAIGTAHLSRRRGELFRGHCHLRDIKALKVRDFKNLVAVLYRKRGFKVDQEDLQRTARTTQVHHARTTHHSSQRDCAGED